MKRLFTVIGLGRFGYSVAQTMVEKGCEVLAIDKDEERIGRIAETLQINAALERMNIIQQLHKALGLNDNVQAMDYPHLLVTGGLHDSQVQYWEPTKWVARLRARKTKTPSR